MRRAHVPKDATFWDETLQPGDLAATLIGDICDSNGVDEFLLSCALKTPKLDIDSQGWSFTSAILSMWMENCWQPGYSCKTNASGSAQHVLASVFCDIPVAILSAWRCEKWCSTTSKSTVSIHSVTYFVTDNFTRVPKKFGTFYIQTSHILTKHHFWGAFTGTPI